MMCLTRERWCCLTWLRIVLEEPFDFWPVCSMWKFWQKSRLILPCSIMCSLQWYFLSSWPCLAWELKQQKWGSEFSNPPSLFFFVCTKIMLIFLSCWWNGMETISLMVEGRSRGREDEGTVTSCCGPRAGGEALGTSSSLQSYAHS